MYIIRITLEVLVALMWIGTATLMIHRKGDCFAFEINDKTLIQNPDCPFTTEDQAPTKTWTIGIVFSIVEV